GEGVTLSVVVEGWRTRSGIGRPMRSPWLSVNQRLPSGPVTIPAGVLVAVMPVLYSVTTPCVVMLPTRSPVNSVNQRLPSGPAVIAWGRAESLGRNSLVTTPAVVIRPIRWAAPSMNHSAPSGADVMLLAFEPSGVGNSWIWSRAGVMVPTLGLPS